MPFNPEHVENIFNELVFGEVVKKLKSGPETRGQKRKTYRLVTGEEADIYSLILKAIAENPPAISINIEDLKRRIDSLMVNTADKLDKIKAAMRQIQGLMKESEALYHVFDGKIMRFTFVSLCFYFIIDGEGNGIIDGQESEMADLYAYKTNLANSIKGAIIDGERLSI